MKKLLLLAAGIALLSVSCRAEMNIFVDINDDRSGTATVEVGLDEEFRGLVESFGATTDDLFAEFNLDTEDGTAIERIEGDMTFTTTTTDFDDISEVTTDMVSGMSANATFSDFSFEMNEDEASFAATTTVDEQDIGDLPFDPSTITDDAFSASFILGMPGNVVEHNADEVLPDGRLKWSLPVLGGTKTLVAESTLGDGSLWWLWIILGAVLVIGAIAIVAAIILGRRQEKQAVSDAAAQYPESVADVVDGPAASSASTTAADAPEVAPPAPPIAGSFSPEVDDSDSSEGRREEETSTGPVGEDDDA